MLSWLQHRGQLATGPSVNTLFFCVDVATFLLENTLILNVKLHPSLMLSSVRSLENKLDLNQPSRSTKHETRDCCVFVFTETWLNHNIPDSTIQLHGLTCCLLPSGDSSLSGKTHRVLSSMYDPKLLPQHCRTTSRTQTGTCSKRRPPTTTTQTCSSTLKL